MMEKDHVHMTFIKSGELVQYQKFWPNHIFFVLPPQFDNGSDSSIKNIIKVYFSTGDWNRLREEGGGQLNFVD